MEELSARIDALMQSLRETVGSHNVMVPVFGGVDSAVTAALLLQALPKENVYAVVVDHGLLRKGESDRICKNLKKLGAVHLKRVSAENEVFNGTVDIGTGRIIGPLSQVSDPLHKRRIIAGMTTRGIARAAAELKIDVSDAFVALDTLHMDLLQSNAVAAGNCAHADADFFSRAERSGRLLEVKAAWCRAEIPAVAKQLGLEESIAFDQPFPAPGLGVRMLCNDSAVLITAEQRDALDAVIAQVNKREIVREAKALHPSEVGYKYVARIAPIRSVGMQEDVRTYRSFSILCGGGLDADFAEVFDVSRTILASVGFLSRVAFRVDCDEPISLLSCHTMHIAHDTVEILRAADAVVADTLMNPRLSQCFAVLLPITSVQDTRYSIAIRAVVSDGFSEARAAVPGVDFSLEALRNTVQALKAALGDKVDMVLYDVTAKPPAAIEWE